MSCTPKPNGFHDHYPYQMAISLGIYPIFRQTLLVLTDYSEMDCYNHLCYNCSFWVCGGLYS